MDVVVNQCLHHKAIRKLSIIANLGISRISSNPEIESFYDKDPFGMSGKMLQVATLGNESSQ